jgi:hypothetical protein
MLNPANFRSCAPEDPERDESSREDDRRPPEEKDGAVSRDSKSFVGKLENSREQEVVAERKPEKVPMHDREEFAPLLLKFAVVLVLEGDCRMRFFGLFLPVKIHLGLNVNRFWL